MAKNQICVDLDVLRTVVQEAITEASRHRLRNDRLSDRQLRYADPQEKNNNETIRQGSRKIAQRIREENEHMQALCAHQKGSSPLSERAEVNDTSIAWHCLDRGGPIIGICTTCQRQFWPKDVDYEFWRTQRTSNIMSAGGQVVINAVPVDDRGLAWAKLPPAATGGLDDLSDEEIASLFEATTKLYQELRPVLDLNKVLGPQA